MTRITIDLTIPEVDKALTIATKWGYCSLEGAIEHMVQHYQEEGVACINRDCINERPDAPYELKCYADEFYKRRSK